MFGTTQCCVAPGNMRENVFNPFSGKAFLITYERFSYGNTHYITNSFFISDKNSRTLA